MSGRAPPATPYGAPAARSGEGVARRVRVGAPWVRPALCGGILGGALVVPVSPAVSAVLAAGLFGAVGTRRTPVPAVIALAALSARGALTGDATDTHASRGPALRVHAARVYHTGAAPSPQPRPTPPTVG